MLRTIAKLVFLAVLVIAGAAVLYKYEQRQSVQVQLEQEKQKTQKLQEIVTHLQTEQRIADIIVTEQREVDGILQTTLLFVEYAKDGKPLPAKRFTYEGKQAHIDALAIVFEGKYLKERDPLRGRSIALFTRLFGDKQTPENAHRIDDPQQIPLIYQGVDPQVSEFEQELWRDFWRLADDAEYRKSMGVRVAQGEGVWRPFDPGFLYTITLDTNGGLFNTSEPLKGIYSEALRLRAEAKASQ